MTALIHNSIYQTLQVVLLNNHIKTNNTVPLRTGKMLYLYWKTIKIYLLLTVCRHCSKLWGYKYQKRFSCCLHNKRKKPTDYTQMHQDSTAENTACQRG